MRCAKKLLFLGMIASIILFAASNGQAGPLGDVPDHPHMFPYTKVLAEDYHLRMIVDHQESEIMLVFEDISEKAVQIMPLKTIDAEVIFAGGDRREFQLKAIDENDVRTHRDAHPVLRLDKRRAGRFVYRADWIKEALDFDLIVSFPFKGKDYKFVFDYSTGGNMFPHHMR